MDEEEIDPSPSSNAEEEVTNKKLRFLTKSKIVSTLARSIGARFLMIAHGIFCVLQTNPFKKNSLHWIFVAPLIAMIPEGIFTYIYLKGKEWKWFCPCVCLYLMSVIPSVWLAEFDVLSMATEKKRSNVTLTDDQAYSISHKQNLSAHYEQNLFGISTGLSFEQETRIIMEEMMLLVLILGRWILPRQQITKEQKSSLLITYIGMSADILEMFEYFKEDKLNDNKHVIVVMLAVWSLSMVQYVLVFTARAGKKVPLSPEDLIFNTDMWSIVINLVVQDAPFLITRFYLLVRFSIVTESSIFFLVKNSLMTSLILHRIHTLISEWLTAKKQAANQEPGGKTLEFNNSNATNRSEKSSQEEEEPLKTLQEN